VAGRGGELKKGRASLIGGIAVAIGVFGLWMLLARDLGAGGAVSAVAGLLVAGSVGTWIRVADL